MTNWHITNTLRSDAQTKFAKAAADAAAGNMWSPGWCEAFNRAALVWASANPPSTLWQGIWPEGAAAFLGNAATDRARQLEAV